MTREMFECLMAIWEEACLFTAFWFLSERGILRREAQNPMPPLFQMFWRQSQTREKSSIFGQTKIAILVSFGVVCDWFLKGGILIARQVLQWWSRTRGSSSIYHLLLANTIACYPSSSVFSLFFCIRDYMSCFWEAKMRLRQAWTIEHFESKINLETVLTVSQASFVLFVCAISPFHARHNTQDKGIHAELRLSALCTFEISICISVNRMDATDIHSW